MDRFGICFKGKMIGFDDLLNVETEDEGVLDTF